MRVLFRTFGCKANQYDTERMRQELEALGSKAVASTAFTVSGVVTNFANGGVVPGAGVSVEGDTVTVTPVEIEISQVSEIVGGVLSNSEDDNEETR